jgi:hypothetical protein
LMHFFCVLFILVMSCPFYSLSLSLVRAYLPLTLPSPVRYSRLAFCLSLSTHTHTISVQGHNKKKEEDKREREKSVVINGHFTH